MSSLRCVVAVALALAGAEPSSGQNVLPCDPYAQPDRRVANLSYSDLIRDIEVVGGRVHVAAGKIDVLELDEFGVPHSVESWDIDASSIAEANGLFYVRTQTPPMELLILRPRASAEPEILSRRTVGGGEVAVQDGIALVGGRVFDVSDPYDPQFLALISGANGETSFDVRLELPYAHLLSYSGYLIEDLSDPSHPVELSSLSYSSWEPRALEIQGHYAYVTLTAGGDSAWAGLSILDSSDRSNPIQSGIQWIPERADELAVTKDGCYVAAFGTLAIFQLESPARARYVETQNLDGYSGLQVAVQGNFVLVGAIRFNGITSLQVFDMSKPRWQPIQSVDETRGNCSRLASSEDFLVTLHLNEGASIYRFAGDALLHVAEADLPKDAWRIAIAGDKAYIAAQAAGVQIMQLSGVDVGEIVGRFETPGSTQDLVVQGDYAYVADSSGFLVLDVADPAHPELVGGCAADVRDRSAVAIEGDTAYLTDGQGSLSALDVSEPHAPALISTATGVASQGEVVLVHGGVAYVLSGSESQLGPRVFVIDVQDPSDMKFLGHGFVPGIVSDAVLVNDLLYVSTRNHGVNILDISDPAVPRSVGAHPVPFGADGVGVSHDRLYFAGSGGLFSGPLHHDCRDVFVDAVLDSIAPGAAGTLLGPAAGTQWNAPFGLTAYPNPSRGDTAVSYRVPAGSRLNLAIYDVSGRIVRTLLDGAGSNVADGLVRWDGRDSAGKRAASGVYFVRIEAGGIEWKRKVVLLQ